MQEVTEEMIDAVPQGFVPMLEIDGLWPSRYYLDPDGNVYDALRSRLLKKTIRKSNGYVQVALRNVDDTKYVFKYVQQLVARHFVRGFETGFIVHHMDGCKTNNSASNLRWMTIYTNSSIGSPLTKHIECATISVELRNH